MCKTIRKIGCPKRRGKKKRKRREREGGTGVGAGGEWEGVGREKTGAKSGEEQDTGRKMFPVFLKQMCNILMFVETLSFNRKIQNSSAKSQNKTRDKAKVLIPMRVLQGKELCE